MKIPDYIEVKNAAGQRVACLSPRADGLKECYIDKRLNGESKLEFLLPANSEKIEELTPECTIWAGGKVFTLLKDDAIDFVRDENNRLWAKYMAKERWAELDTKFPEPYITNDPTIPEPADLAVIIVGGGSDLSGGRYDVGTAGHALYAVLDGSGWTLGACDVTGIHDLEVEKVSRLELIKMVQDMWGGYLVWDSVNKVVHLRDGGKWQNYTGFQIRYAKNLKHITRTQSNRLVTKLYCFGHDDLDIASVNGGKKYITNNSYTPREYVGIYKNQDIYDPNELLEKATAELELICRPRYNYTVKIADLRTLPEYEHEDFSLGDMVDIIDPSVAQDKPQVRLIRHRYNVFQPWKCDIELGDPQERLAEQLKASFDTSNFVDGKFNGSGRSSGYSIENMSIGNAKIKNLDAAKITTGYLSADRIEAGSIGANKIKTEELEVGTNIAMGPDATIAWSQVTNANAYSLDAWKNSGYATHILPDGIYTGTVAANKILIGGENGSISFVDLSDKPFIPSDAADVGALPSDTYIPPEYTDSKALQAWANSNYSTYINANGVYSGSFNGGMFNINPTGSPDLESGLTIGGYWRGSWKGQALQIKFYENTDAFGTPGTVLSSSGSIPLIFQINTEHQDYVTFTSTSTVRFNGDVDFTDAEVTGLQGGGIAVFG